MSRSKVNPSVGVEWGKVRCGAALLGDTCAPRAFPLLNMQRGHLDWLKHLVEARISVFLRLESRSPERIPLDEGAGSELRQFRARPGTQP